MPEHLVETLCPALALVPRITERGGLLVVQDGRRAVRNTDALKDAASRELDVLGKKMPLPTAGLVDDVGSDEEAGARNGAAGMKVQTGLAKEFGLTEEPHGVTGGDPVGIIVLGIAVASGGLRAVVEGLVHLTEVIHIKDIVGVEHEVRLVPAVRIILVDDLERMVKRVALANLLGVEAFENRGAFGSGNLRRVVGAVVGNHEHVDQFLRVVLNFDGMNEIGDNRALVACGDDNGEAMILLRGDGLWTMNKNLNHVEKLVGVANRENKEHAQIEDVHKRHLRYELIDHSFPVLSWTRANSHPPLDAFCAEGDYSYFKGGQHRQAETGEDTPLFRCE